MPIPTEFYTPAEVAKIMKVTPSTVYDWLKSGKLGSFRPAGRWRISPEHFNAFINGGSPPAASPPSPAPPPVAPAPAEPPKLSHNQMRKQNRRR